LFLENGITLQDRISIYQMSVNCSCGRVWLLLLRVSGTESTLEMKIVQKVENVQNINVKFTEMFWVWMTYRRFTFSYW